MTSTTKCSSPSALSAVLEVARQKVSLQETVASWDKIEQGIVQLIRCCNTGGCAFATEMVAGIRSLSTPLNNAVNSERSKLSGSAIELITALSVGLGLAFEPLVSIFIPTLLALCARTNTVFTRRAKASILAVIENTRLPSILPYLTQAVNHKSASLRLTAAKGVLACLNSFKSLDDTRTHLIEDVIKATSQDPRVDVRKAGQSILQAYKAILPDRVESFIALSPVTKKSVMQCTAASRSTSPVLSRSRPTAGRVRPTAPVQAEKSSSGTHSERQSHPLRAVPAIRPNSVSNDANSSRQYALRPPSESGPSSVQSTSQRRNVARPLVSTVKRKQRVGNKGANVPCAAQELSRKHSATCRVPSEPSSSSVQRKDIIRPLVPTIQRSSTSATQRSKRVGTMLTSSHGEGPRVRERARKVIAPTPLLVNNGAEIARTRIRKTRPLSVKPSAVPNPPISKCNPKTKPVATKVELQAAPPQASHKRSRPGQQAVGQKKPVGGGHSESKAPKSSLKALLNALQACGSDTRMSPIHTATVCPTAEPLLSSSLFGLPPVGPAASGDPPVHITSHMLVPQDVNRPSYMGCRNRRGPRRQDPRFGVSFFTSSPRASLSSQFSPLRAYGAKVIPHAHNPDISCFQGCELQEVLERLDIELEHAALILFS